MNSMQSTRPLASLSKKTGLLIAGLICLLGLALIVLSQYRNFTLLVNEEPVHVRTFAWTPAKVIRQVGYSLQNDDQVIPAVEKIDFNLPGVIFLNLARPVQIFTPMQTFTLQTTERYPANLLAMAGILLFPGDRVLQNGQEINPLEAMPAGKAIILQFEPAKEIVISDGYAQTFIYTQVRTLGEALAAINFPLDPNDTLSQPLDLLLQQTNTVSITRAHPVEVSIGDQLIQGKTPAQTVGDALVDLGIPLEGMDFTRPPADSPLPEDGKIELIRVSEEITLQKEETAYTNTYTEDPNTELDHTSVIEPGQVGLKVVRERVRFENGIETARLTEGPWKASDPSAGVMGYGTKVVIRTETINGDTIEYWRKVSVYATSYKPSSQGGGTGTASGMKLTKGVVAVSAYWYGGMEFQQVYIPGYGYGVIADTGGGIPGRYWIDLGYDDSNYESWHNWTTLYFLTPVPAFIPAVLP